MNTFKYTQQYRGYSGKPKEKPQFCLEIVRVPTKFTRGTEEWIGLLKKMVFLILHLEV